MNIEMNPGLTVINGEVVGRDPRTMTPEELMALGHKPAPILDIAHAKCVDCCGGSASEARKCVAVRCPQWPYRTAVNPFRAKRELSDDQKAALKERLQGAST